MLSLSSARTVQASASIMQSRHNGPSNIMLTVIRLTASLAQLIVTISEIPQPGISYENVGFGNTMYLLINYSVLSW